MEGNSWDCGDLPVVTLGERLRRERNARTDAPRVPWPLNMAMWIATARVGCHELDLPNCYHYHQNKVIKYDEGRT